MKITRIIHLSRHTCLFFLLLLLVACGGGGGAEVDQSLNDPNTLNNSNTVSDGDNDGFDDDQDNCPADNNPDQSDLDNDGSGDVCDSDDDGDGTDDTADNCSTESNADQTDTDNDGFGDACDIDDDADGVTDANDNCRTVANVNQTDSDNDGIGDACDPVNNNTSSNNDSDDDGISDSADNCPNIDNPNQADNDNDGNGDLCDSDDDNDGISDTADNCVLVSNQDQSDTDNDDYGDACDIDDDGDTVTDASDNCPLIENQNQADQDNDGIGDACDPVNNNNNSNTDSDNDGIVDSSDNCPTTSNTNQQDSDNDGVGDVCDAVNDDPDMDGVLNPNDNCPTIANSDQADADSDSIGDACDSSNDDPDLDGVLSANDNCPTVDNSDQLDADNDGIGDACDAINDDPDNDGILNANDNCPNDANPLQEDGDNNGVGDACETTANQFPIAVAAAQASASTVDFDASGSNDPDGTITNYDWEFGDNNTATGISTTHTYAAGGSYEVILTVTDNDGSSSSSTISISVVDSSLPIQSISQGVQAADDDAEQKSDTTTNTGSSDLEMVQDFTETQTIGIRFDQLAVPRNATITAAWIQFTADEENDEPTNLVIEGERTGNSFEFDWEDSSVTNRPRTAAANHVSWSPSAWEIDDAGAAQKTPDLAAIVQEIVNLNTWDYENAMTFIISGSGKRVAYSYDSDPAKAAVLHVEFQSNYVPPTIDVLRGPYLQQGTSNSMIIRWRTDVAGDSVVHYGASGNNLNMTETLSGSRTEHEVKLTGLSPDTRYYYAIETNGEDLSGLPTVTWFETNPVIGSTDPVRVWVIGDPGTADSSQQSVYNAYNTYTGSTHTDLWIMLGDNAYPDGTDEEYQAAMYDVYPDLLERSVVWPTLGNHDQRSASSFDQSGVYFDMFSLPKAGEAGGEPSGTEAYYSFDYGNIHFICLNSVDVSTSSTSAQMQWLNDDLDNNNQTWTIAFWHHPPYSKGSHDSDTSGQETDMREEVLPILEAKGIDLVLSGHSHSYERSFLLDGHYHTSDTLDASMIKDGGNGSTNGDGAYQKQFPTAANDGAIYSVVGASGKTSDGPLDHPVMIYSEARLGSLVIDVTDKTLKATYIDNFGNARDDFTIEK